MFTFEQGEQPHNPSSALLEEDRRVGSQVLEEKHFLDFSFFNLSTHLKMLTFAHYGDDSSS